MEKTDQEKIKITDEILRKQGRDPEGSVNRRRRKFWKFVAYGILIMSLLRQSIRFHENRKVSK